MPAKKKAQRRRDNNRTSPGFFLSQARFPKRALFSSPTTSASTAKGQHTFDTAANRQATKYLVRFFGNLLTLRIHFPKQSPKLF